MEHFVRFKMSTKDMSNDALEQVMATFIQEHGVSEVIDAMWSHAYLQYTSSANANTRMIERLNSIVGQVHLQSANVPSVSDDSEQGQQVENEKRRIGIDCVHNALINRIGTFVGWRDLPSMECVSRTFLVALRLPCPVFELTSRRICKYVEYCQQKRLPVDFNRFRRIKRLCLDWSEIEQCATFFGDAFKHVSDLWIYNSDMVKISQAFDDHFDAFSITKLRLGVSPSLSDPDNDFLLLCQLLARLHNIKTLEIHAQDGLAQFDEDIETALSTHFGSCCPDLAELRINLSFALNNTILLLLQNDIQSLNIATVDGYDTNDFIPEYSGWRGWRNLQELTIRCNFSRMHAYLTKYGWSQMPHLEKLAVCSYFFDGDKQDVDAFVDAVFMNTNLRYFKIDISAGCWFEWDSHPIALFLKAIASALPNYRRDVLAINLSFDTMVGTVPPADVTDDEFLRLLECLQASTANQFCLVVPSLSKNPSKETLAALDQMVEVENDNKTTRFRSKGFCQEIA